MDMEKGATTQGSPIAWAILFQNPDMNNLLQLSCREQGTADGKERNQMATKSGRHERPGIEIQVH